MTSTAFIKDSPGNWDESAVQTLLDVAEKSVTESIEELKIRGGQDQLIMLQAPAK